MTRSRMWSVVVFAGLLLLLPVFSLLAQPAAPKEKEKAAPAPATDAKDAAKNADTPKADAPKTDTPAPPAPDAPKTDAPKTDTPVVEPPTVPEAPIVLTIEQVQAQRKDIEAATNIEKEVKDAVLLILGDTEARLANEATEKAETLKAKRDLEMLPVEAERIRKELAALNEAPPAPFVVEMTAETTARQLETQLAQARQELAERQKRVTDTEELIRVRRDAPTQYREKLAAARKALEDIDRESKLPAPPNETPQMAAARKLLFEARRRQRRAEVERYEQELLAHDARQVHRAALRDQAARLVPEAEQKIKAIQEALTTQTRKEAEMAAQVAEQALRDAVNKHPEIRKLIEGNAADLKRRDELAARRASVDKRIVEGEKTKAALLAEYAEVESKISKSGGIDQRMARDLTKRRRTLPNVRTLTRNLADMDTVVHDLEAEQDKLKEQRHELDAFEQVVAATMASVGDDVSAKEKTEIEAEIRKLLSDRARFISTQIDDYDTLYSKTRDLQAVTQELIKESRRFAAFIEENLLWIADAQPISLGSFKEAGVAAWWLVNPENLGDFAATLQKQALDALPATIIVLLVFVGLLLLRRRVNHALANIDNQLKRIDTDHFMLTPQAIGLTLLLALPWPVLLLYISIIVRQSWAISEFTRVSAAGIGAAAIGYYMLRTLIHFLKPQGIAETHLRWTTNSTSILRNNLVWLLLALVPAAYILTALMSYDDDTFADSLARLVYIAFMIAIAVFLYRVLHPRKGAVATAVAENPGGLLARTRVLWFPLALLMPLTPAVLATIGYFYTARQIGGSRLSASMWLLLGILTFHSLLLRWLYVAQRRLALQKAREKREARATTATQTAATGSTGDAAASGGIVTTPDTALDLAQINEQTQQIVRALFAIATVVGIYFIWSGVLPALRVLDQVNLWAHSIKPDGTPQYITLASVLLAVLIGFFTAVASKNVPGLLEITILKRTPLDAGGRYAFATITRYVISAAGIVIAFQAIGIGWSQVQWLVAAVSLGLGFGLQEIFANFVSGLIILFERPIRVGDTVTVGGVSGTVSRIRIRATTIVDWDRKELIIPNKEFITGQIMNWTLTDTISRVVIPVGVAYGSDVVLVQRLLNDVVKNHPLVLDEPEPSIVFTGFGDSSLDFSIRFFVRVLGDRIPTTHTLLESIDRVFRQHNIEIPFPQRDLHVRTVAPGVSFMGNGSGHNGDGGNNGDGGKRDGSDAGQGKQGATQPQVK